MMPCVGLGRVEMGPCIETLQKALEALSVQAGELRITIAAHGVGGLEAFV